MNKGISIPDNVAPEEELGRSVFHSRYMKQAQRLGHAVPEVFLYKEGSREISVDRLDFASPDEMARISTVGEANRPGQKFRGWAVITAGKAGENGRCVQASPDCGNPYHADIILPEIAAEDREEQKWHAQELADMSCWRERPQSDST